MRARKLSSCRYTQTFQNYNDNSQRYSTQDISDISPQKFLLIQHDQDSNGISPAKGSFNYQSLCYENSFSNLRAHDSSQKAGFRKYTTKLGSAF